jgi:hypothetical protein
MGSISFPIDSLPRPSGENGRVTISDNSYRTVLVSRCQSMPEKTMRKLAELARGGATILFEEKLPTDVSGPCQS